MTSGIFPPHEDAVHLIVPSLIPGLYEYPNQTQKYKVQS